MKTNEQRDAAIDALIRYATRKEPFISHTVTCGCSVQCYARSAWNAPSVEREPEKDEECAYPKCGRERYSIFHACGAFKPHSPCLCCHAFVAPLPPEPSRRTNKELINRLRAACKSEPYPLGGTVVRYTEAASPALFWDAADALEAEPAIEITDEMVERALNSYWKGDAKGNEPYDSNTRTRMRAALETVLGGKR